MMHRINSMIAKIGLTAFTLLSTIFYPVLASAQIPAALPMKSSVAPTKATPVDGVYIISTLGKRIKIDRGRGYMIDPWVQALLWEVQTDMVTLKNFQSVGDGVYEADDLPMAAKVRFTLGNQGELNGVVNGLEYKLIPVAESDPLLSGKISKNPEGNASASSPMFQVKSGSIGSPSSTPKFVSYDAHTGCDVSEDLLSPAENPRVRIEQAASVDPITQRTFASFSLDEIEDGDLDDGMDSLCWYRMDGVWQQNSTLAVDDKKEDARVWGSASPELLALANGNYTRPKHLFIGSTGNDTQEVYLTDGLSGQIYTRFVSKDGLSMKEVLTSGGPIKTFKAVGPSSLGSRLELDMGASGRPRIRLDKQLYLRPKPSASQEKMDGQSGADDVFVVSYNLLNLAASRKGYDIVTQDPFLLLDNKKAEVFAVSASREYAITEQKSVPLGLLINQDATQGMIYNKTVVSSGRQVQETISGSLGGSVGVGNEATTKSSVSADASFELMNSMKTNNVAGQIIAYSRSKKYALVLDDPFTTLSKNFLDAIYDAKARGFYDDIIERFGTHYPYAVTYGAAGKLTTSISEESYQKDASRNVNISGEYSVEGVAGDGSIRASYGNKQATGTTGSTAKDNTVFVAAGGNGSWDQNGFSAGETPYPILLDLRPLFELLNPMNFPDDPEIYTDVRNKLENKTIAYLTKYSDKVDDKSLLEDIKITPPEPIEKWQVYVKRVWCDDSGMTAGTFHKAVGDISFELINGTTVFKSGVREFSAKCKSKYREHIVKGNYKNNQNGLVVIQGTKNELKQFELKLDLDWRYNNTGIKRDDKKTYKSTPLKKAIKVKENQEYTWSVGPKGKPEFVFVIRFKRVG